MNKDTKVVRKMENIGGYKVGKIEQCHNGKGLEFYANILGFFTL